MSNLHVPSSFVAGAIIAGKYRLLRRLGQGSMSVVFSAENLATSGEVALKLLTRPEAELRPRLMREARACSRIRHKNVIQVQDVGFAEDGDPFLVMVLLSGETLADLLDRKRRISQEEAISIGRDVARALSAAHDKGVVHRDLKPANVFLHEQAGEDARVVKVLDFGISKNLLTPDGLNTTVGCHIGSPMYMSPEQARAASDVDGRTDIWSLGVLLFEMITGSRPFDGEVPEVIRRILSDEIPQASRRVRGVDPLLEQWIMACLRRDRDHRPWPASQIADALDARLSRADRAPLPSCASVSPEPPRAPAADMDWGRETQPVEPRLLPAAIWPPSFREGAAKATDVVPNGAPGPEILAGSNGVPRPPPELNKAFLQTVRLSPEEAAPAQIAFMDPPAHEAAPPDPSAFTMPPVGGVRSHVGVIAIVTVGSIAASLALAALLMRAAPRASSRAPAATPTLATPPASAIEAPNIGAPAPVETGWPGDPAPIATASATAGPAGPPRVQGTSSEPRGVRPKLPVVSKQPCTFLKNCRR